MLSSIQCRAVSTAAVTVKRVLYHYGRDDKRYVEDDIRYEF